jgi:Lon protease-like protein
VVDLPLFALHTVLYPGARLGLRVFEERYLRMMEDVLPEGPFAIAAIRYGREVGGAYEPYDVGVTVTTEDHELGDDGTYAIRVRATDRVRLLEVVASTPYARWRVEPYPEDGEADATVGAAAVTAAASFLDVAGIDAELAMDPDATRLSYALAGLTPLLVPERQALLELPGPAERLDRLTRVFRREAGLLRALRQRRGR